MFKLIKLAPFALMAWRWYKGQKAQNAAAGNVVGNNPAAWNGLNRRR